MSKKKLSFIFLCIIGQTAFTHPHMWFTSEVEFIFKDTSISGAYVTWTFDKFFSADIISGYDLNKDGKFDRLEADDVYDNAFTYTQNYYYFTFIRQGSIRTSPDKISKSSFSVFQKNNIVSYKFYVDLTEFKGNELFFACYDYTYFCDITYPESSAVSFVYDNKKLSPKYSIQENKNNPIYYNPVGAIDDNRIYYKWAPGLNTYYPREIKLTF